MRDLKNISVVPKPRPGWHCGKSGTVIGRILNKQLTCQIKFKLICL